MKQVLAISLFGLILFIIPWQFTENKELPEDTLISNNYEIKYQKELNGIPEITSTFKLADVGFYPELVNEPLNALYYSGKRKVAANTGVYMASLMYTKNFAPIEQARNNFGAIMQLSKNAGLNNEVSDILYERYENGNNSSDEIEAMLRNALANSKENLSKQKQDQLYAYLVVGNYIEKLYLTSSFIMRPKQTKLPESNEAMLKRNLLAYVSHQSGQLNEILELLYTFEGDQDDELMRTEIFRLMDRYEALEMQRDEIQSLPVEEIFKTEQVEDIYYQIKKIRNNIIA